MDFALIAQQQALAKATDELMRLNDVTVQYGLSLTAEAAQALITARQQTLTDLGRIALGQSALPRLIMAFCDSPYLDSRNYADTLLALQDIFCSLQSDLEGALTDDELIEGMKAVFDGVAQGSLDYLSDVDPRKLFMSLSGKRYRQWEDE